MPLALLLLGACALSPHWGAPALVLLLVLPQYPQQLSGTEVPLAQMLHQSLVQFLHTPLPPCAAYWPEGHLTHAEAVNFSEVMLLPLVSFVVLGTAPHTLLLSGVVTPARMPRRVHSSVPTPVQHISMYIRPGPTLGAYILASARDVQVQLVVNGCRRRGSRRRRDGYRRRSRALDHEHEAAGIRTQRRHMVRLVTTLNSWRTPSVRPAPQLRSLLLVQVCMSY